MAGICGVIGIEDKSLVKKMASLMVHRGEITEVLTDNGVTMASLRQPDETGLYNARPISIALDQDIYAINNRPIEDKSHIYAHLTTLASSEEAIKGLRGNFAFAIVNTVNKETKLTLARDIYGTRSMYYFKADKTFFFASEMKCFLAINEFRPEINEEALNYYLTCGFSPNRQTLLKSVYKVLPAEIIEFKDGSLHFGKYWSPTSSKPMPLSLDHWAELTWQKLLNTTKALLPSDEPRIGVALSGGLDSSLIAAALRQADEKREIVAFSLDYGDKDKTELKIAEKVAKSLNMDWHPVPVEPERFIDDVEKLQWLYDEPLIKFTFIPTYYLFNAAKKHVKTLFSGDGGDELFIGYRKDYWQDPFIIKLFSKLGSLRRPLLRISKSIAGPVANFTGSKVLSLANEFFSRDYASHSQWQHRVASRVFQPYFAEEELPMLLKDCQFRGITDKIVELINMTNSTNAVEKISQTMLMGSLPNDLLRLEKAAVATALKVRSPLLDPEMTNFALSIPISLRYRSGTTKYLIRYLTRKYSLLPQEVVTQRLKRGLTAPIYQWLTESPTQEYFARSVQSTNSLQSLNTAYLPQFYPPKTYTQTLKAWNLMGILLWLKIFSDKDLPDGRAI